MISVSDNFDFDSSKKSVFIRTKFGTSFLFLWIQVFFPALILYFLVSKDLTFTFSLPKWWGVILACLGLILFTIIATSITYSFKLHELDQYTYAVPFTFALSYLILSSYFGDIIINQFLFRFIFLFLAAIIGMIITSLVLFLFLRKKINNEKLNE